MPRSNGIGEYLRARRELIRPEEVGLPGGGRRKVAGLRREELAMLAGISADYYLRLEQGRDQNPSAQVLNALARVLNLDADSVTYLHELAAARSAQPARRPADRVPPGTRQLLDELPMPAFIQNKYFDVLAANRPARALSPSYRPGVNLLRAVFLDPQDRILHDDWDRATSQAVGGLRAATATDPGDPHLTELVGELCLRSDEFRRLWARHDVHRREGGTSRINHPRAGMLHLRHEKLAVSGTDGQLMVVYHAEPGSDSAKALKALGEITVG